MLAVRAVRALLEADGASAARLATRALKVSSTLRTLLLLRSESVVRLVGTASPLAMAVGAVPPLSTVSAEASFLSAAETVRSRRGSLRRGLAGLLSPMR